MSNRDFKNMIFTGLAAIMLFAPLARGAVRLWSITFIQWVAFTLVFLWFWQMNNHSGWKFKATKLDLPIWGFVGLAIGSCFFSIYPYAGMLDVLRVMMYVAVYYLVVNFFDWNLQTRFFWLVILIGTALSLLGIGQYFGGLDRSWWSGTGLSATYVNHAHFAGYLEMAMALNVGMLLGLTRDDVISSFHLLYKRLILAGTMGLMITAFVLSHSRGAWISFTLAVCVLSAVLAHQKIISKRRFAAFLMGVALFIVFLGLGEDRIAHRMHTIEMSEESQLMRGRMEVWENSLQIVKDHPLTGTGIGTFVWAFPRYRPEGFRVRYHYAHNDYLHMAVEMGIFVIPLFLWGGFVVLKQGFSDFDLRGPLINRMMRLGCATGVLSLIIHGFVDFNFHIPANMIVFVCLIGILMKEAEVER